MRIDWGRLIKIVMLSLVLAWVTMFFVEHAFAGEVTMSWTNPTETFTLTTAGAYTNPGGTKIYMEVLDITDPTLETAVIPGLKPGTYNFVGVTYSDTGEASPVSNTATKEVTQWVTTNIVIKIVAKIPNGFLLLGVGTVPLGTPCDVEQEVRGHYVVPQAGAEIVWSDPERNAGTAELPLVVVAECG